jgi:hypothetical protein
MHRSAEPWRPLVAERGWGRQYRTWVAAALTAALLPEH